MIGVMVLRERPAIFVGAVCIRKQSNGVCACDFHWQQVVVIALHCRLIIVSPARLSSMGTYMRLALAPFFMLIFKVFPGISILFARYISHLLFPVHIRHLPV